MTPQHEDYYELPLYLGCKMLQPAAFSLIFLFNKKQMGITTRRLQYNTSCIGDLRETQAKIDGEAEANDGWRQFLQL